MPMTPTTKGSAMANGVKTSCPVCQSPHIDIAYWTPCLALGEILVHQCCQGCPATWTGRYVLRAVQDLDARGDSARPAARHEA